MFIRVSYNIQWGKSRSKSNYFSRITGVSFNEGELVLCVMIAPVTLSACTFCSMRSILASMVLSFEVIPQPLQSMNIQKTITYNQNLESGSLYLHSHLSLIFILLLKIKENRLAQFNCPADIVPDG
jgi:hypothetical protein